MSILRDLWWGQEAPVERKIQPWDEYSQMLKDISETEDKLRSEMTDKGRGLLEHFDNSMHSAAAISEEDAFVTGFRMGARIMLDVLRGNG